MSFPEAQRTAIMYERSRRFGIYAQALTPNCDDYRSVAPHLTHPVCTPLSGKIETCLQTANSIASNENNLRSGVILLITLCILTDGEYS